MRICLLLTAIFALAACGGGDADKQAEYEAALEAAKPEFAARQANIDAALKEAEAWRAKADVPELSWADRPAAKFLDARNDKLNREPNGRVFELSAGALNTDGKTLLGLFIDDEWSDLAQETTTGKGTHTKGAVESALERFKHVRFLCLLITDEYGEATFGEGSLFSVKFTPAHWRGRAFYFDLEQGKLIGGKRIDVRNPDKLEFKTAGFDEAEQRKTAQSTADEDIRKRIFDAAATP